MHRVKKSALSIVFLWTTLSLTLLGATSASAAPKPAPVDPPPLDLPAGWACDFALTIETHGPQVWKEIRDDDGNLVAAYAAGKGSVLTFIGNGETLTLTTGGSVTHVTYHLDGSSTWVGTGHNVLVLFPTDLPAGPSTTLIVGRIVFTVDASGVYTVTDVRGTTTDICAELSS